MLITKLKGGLGNQLFQYAVARAIGEEFIEPVLIDCTAYAKQKNYRNPDIMALNIRATVATKADIEMFVTFNWLYNRKPNWLTSFTNHTYIENKFSYNPEIEYQKPPVFLDGYWQSEKYFEAIKPILQREFTVKEAYITNLQPLTNTIHNSQAVAIHIRRGDYTNRKLLAVHGVLPLSYYTAAIEQLKATHSNLTFYIFSDAIQWVKDNWNFGTTPVQYASLQTTSVLHDFYLMQQCQHFIIANSTLSWWAAWLSTTNPNKQVIAPKQWFAKGPTDVDDLIPATWQVI